MRALLPEFDLVVPVTGVKVSRWLAVARLARD
jgi:hypothetical protein